LHVALTPRRSPCCYWLLGGREFGRSLIARRQRAADGAFQVRPAPPVVGTSLVVAVLETYQTALRLDQGDERYLALLVSGLRRLDVARGGAEDFVLVEAHHTPALAELGGRLLDLKVDLVCQAIQLGLPLGEFGLRLGDGPLAPRQPHRQVDADADLRAQLP